MTPEGVTKSKVEDKGRLQNCEVSKHAQAEVLGGVVGDDTYSERFVECV